ncbi:YlxR family protein [Cellulomonas edaphi]|uniref:YlxR family protein n=1 Tax=Cellulomonas edaphi TaxID=3053468 RepID=UPI003898EEBB
MQDQLVVDVARSMPGRGAWLHPDPGCLELATRRRAFGRALRHAGPLDTAPISAELESDLQGHNDAG